MEWMRVCFSVCRWLNIYLTIRLFWLIIEFIAFWTKYLIVISIKLKPQMVYLHTHTSVFTYDTYHIRFIDYFRYCRTLQKHIAISKWRLFPFPIIYMSSKASATISRKSTSATFISCDIRTENRSFRHWNATLLLVLLLLKSQYSITDTAGFQNIANSQDKTDSIIVFSAADSPALLNLDPVSPLDSREPKAKCLLRSGLHLVSELLVLFFSRCEVSTIVF